MLGWAEENGIPMLLVEYCKQGDLLHLLRSKKDEIIKVFQILQIAQVFYKGIYKLLLVLISYYLQCFARLTFLAKN